MNYVEHESGVVSSDVLPKRYWSCSIVQIAILLVIRSGCILALSVTQECPETCLNGTVQSVDAQDNQYDTLLLSCSVTQTL